MLAATSTWVLVLVVLAVFAWLGLRVGADRNVEGFALAHRGESGRSIGWSFLASGLGAWLLAAPPEIGATSGLVGVAGYVVGVALPLVALVVLGRRVRALLPQGRSLADFARHRYGRAMQLTVAVITLFYMGVVAAAELTAAGGILAQLTGVDSRWILAAIVLVTLVYTAYGGLRASLRTDAWQAWLLVGLVVAAGGMLLTRLPEPGAAVARGLGQDTTLVDLEVAVTLIVAILVTTLFHNGMWQRVWAARDDRALRRGAVIGIATRVPLVAAAGLIGVLAVGLGVDLGDPPMPLFALLDGLPAGVMVVLLAMLVALVASSIDTVENGIAALVATEVPRVGLGGARAATAVAVVPALLVAFQGWSVVRLLMIANLLCAVAVAPAVLGLWRRSTTPGAVAGTAGGLAGAGVYAVAVADDVAGAVAVATFAEGPRLGPLAAAMAAAALVTVIGSLVRPRAPEPLVGDRAG